MKLSLKIIVGVNLILISVYIMQAIVRAIIEKTGLISEGLLLGFIFLMLSFSWLIVLGVIGRYFEKEMNLKKQKEA